MQCNFTDYKWLNGREIRLCCEHSEIFHRTKICQNIETKKSQSELNANIEQSCRRQKHVAIKTIRIPDIGSLEGLVSDPELNVKLIHLIRDPRAVIMSRNAVHFQKDENHCDELRNNLRYLENPPDWLRGRHMLLRYEDLADDPLVIAEKIYRFIGSDVVPAEVKAWLQINTNRKSDNPYSRSRVSNESAHAWRQKIAYSLCVDIQRMCRVPLMLAGYRSVSSIDDLRNMNVPMLTKLP